ncbi:MAG: hypothetical protein ASARMPRED_001785 [Alectoria sarmentosa]|nr:MAG: hypothetical protein ASARMPRED_001785 [Alectoria sarmentosa]
MSLEAFPNEILLQIFKDLYPPGAWKYWAPYELENETLYPPHSYQTPDWKPSTDPQYTNFDRTRQYWGALWKADLAMQAFAAMNHRLRELSRDILALRASNQVIMISMGPVLPEDLTWGMLLRVMRSRDDTMASILETIDEEAKAKDAEAKEAKEEEE